MSFLKEEGRGDATFLLIAGYLSISKCHLQNKVTFYSSKCPFLFFWTLPYDSRLFPVNPSLFMREWEKYDTLPFCENLENSTLPPLGSNYGDSQLK